MIFGDVRHHAGEVSDAVWLTYGSGLGSGDGIRMMPSLRRKAPVRYLTMVQTRQNSANCASLG